VTLSGYFLSSSAQKYSLRLKLREIEESVANVAETFHFLTSCILEDFIGSEAQQKEKIERQTQAIE
jgi:hypothetical protein